ncbi:hypothetical protein PO909_028688 [Leuciscus waleckii]
MKEEGSLSDMQGNSYTVGILQRCKLIRACVGQTSNARPPQQTRKMKKKDRCTSGKVSHTNTETALSDLSGTAGILWSAGLSPRPSPE